jgi:NAD(P)-dependent dehydrogenase (short-subunit alcohol dehydrogenase family)
MEMWLREFQTRYPIDLVIANAGISAGTGGVLSGEPIDQARLVFDTNLMGVLNTIEPVIEPMQGRGHGQIAIISSLAGFVGWPGAPAYCGSKAAARIYGEALRRSLGKSGVGVSVICPGFVESRITAVNDFPRGRSEFCVRV